MVIRIWKTKTIELLNLGWLNLTIAAICSRRDLSLTFLWYVLGQVVFLFYSILVSLCIALNPPHVCMQANANITSVRLHTIF